MIDPRFIVDFGVAGHVIVDTQTPVNRNRIVFFKDERLADLDVPAGECWSGMYFASRRTAARVADTLNKEASTEASATSPRS